jgi:hypothetical protein
MAGVARIPRSRGGLCGLLLILLGAWGALVPFVGPYFSFAFTPDKAWSYNSGRLYLSIVPGAVAVLGGVAILLTRVRWLGITGGVLAVLAGGWFIFGTGVVQIVLNKTSISPGSPVASTGPVIHSAQTWQFLEEIGFFTGVGAVLILLGAIAMGRLTMLSASDLADNNDFDDFDATPDPATTGSFSSGSTAPYATPSGQFTPSPRPFAGEETTATQDAVPSGSSTGTFPAATSSSPFPPAPNPFSQSPAPSPFPRSTSQFPTTGSNNTES